VYIREAYAKLVVNAVTVSDAEIDSVYAANPGDFTSKPRRTIRAFLFDDEKTAKKMRKKVVKLLAKGLDNEIIALLRANCAFTNKDGVIANVTDNGTIPGMGPDSTFALQVWATPLGKVSPIFVNNKGQYAFLNVMEDNPAQLAPLEQVSPSIRNKLARDRTRARFQAVNEELAAKYHLQKHPELLVTDYSCEELFTKAEDAQRNKKYTDAVMYYDEIIHNFANGKDDYKALFMKAFLMAEDMKQVPQAIQVFQQLINNYPEGELHESARFMIQSLTGAIDIMQQIEEDEAQQKN